MFTHLVRSLLGTTRLSDEDMDKLTNWRSTYYGN